MPIVALVENHVGCVWQCFAASPGKHTTHNCSARTQTNVDSLSNYLTVVHLFICLPGWHLSCLHLHLELFPYFAFTCVLLRLLMYSTDWPLYVNEAMCLCEMHFRTEGHGCFHCSCPTPFGLRLARLACSPLSFSLPVRSLSTCGMQHRSAGCQFLMACMLPQLLFPDAGFWLCADPRCKRCQP